MTTNPPRTFTELLDRLGGHAAVAEKTKRDPSAVLYWHRRNSIRPRYWPEVIALADAEGVDGVDERFLASLAIERDAAAGKSADAAKPDEAAA